MPTALCEECDASVPEAELCLSCGTPLAVDCIPSDEGYKHGFSNRLSDQALAADHESVSFDTLRSTHETYDRPLGGYLYPDEQPEAVLPFSKVAIDSPSETSWTAKTGLFTQGHLLVTDARLVAVIPRDDGDQIVPLHFRETTAVESRAKLLNSGFSVTLADKSTYTYSLDDVGDEPLEEAVTMVQELSDAHDTAESRAGRFIQDVDAVIAESETAEDALREVADLFAARDEETHFDAVVAEATSVDELLVALSLSSAAGAAPPAPAEDADTDGAAPNYPPTRRPQLSNLKQHVKYTAQNADPADVAKYSLAAGVGFGVYAVSAPFSTTLGLAALAAGGAATGAYASAHPDSLAARIDPVALALNANTRGRQMKAAPGPTGLGAGTALGAIEYLGSEAASEEYAQWVANADFDSMMEGARLAAKAAEQSPAFENPNHAAALGGGMGLMYGYLDEPQQRDIEELLDADLYETLEAAEESDDAASIEME